MSHVRDDACAARYQSCTNVVARLTLAGHLYLHGERDFHESQAAGIRLPDPGMTELGRLEVSDGRSGETALVLGSFRRRSNGDWDFVLGGKGYTGGLEELVQDYGIDVE
ncbi:TerD family protein [Streptomyces griseoruber]|nr:TerD family protein [Streptomyces griseoruber]